MERVKAYRTHRCLCNILRWSRGLDCIWKLLALVLWRFLQLQAPRLRRRAQVMVTVHVHIKLLGLQEIRRLEGRQWSEAAGLPN
jgi:hypothetical protein